MTKIETFIRPGQGRKHALGSRTKAQRLYEALTKDAWGHEIEARTGLRYLGGGAYKTAYTDGKFVYKFAIGGDSYQCSDDCQTPHDGTLAFSQEALLIEFDRCEELHAEGYRWVAPTSLYVFDGFPIMVQPKYRRGYAETPCQERYAEQAADLIEDMYAGNWLVTNRRSQIRVIDFAGHASGPLWPRTTYAS